MSKVHIHYQFHTWVGYISHPCDGPDVTFSYIYTSKKKLGQISYGKLHTWKLIKKMSRFHVWKMMDQMWHFREWSFLYKNSQFCLFFMNEFICMKRHVWSIAHTWHVEIIEVQMYITKTLYPFSPGILAPQRGGTSKSVQYLTFFDNIIFYDVSKTTYFYGADPANVKNVVKKFARDVLRTPKYWYVFKLT